MYAHTAKEAVERSPRRNWTLRRMDLEVRRGAEVPKPPHDRGVETRSDDGVPAPAVCSRLHAPSLMKDCGEPVSRRATQGNVVVAVGPLWICTRVVKDASSTVTMPSTRQGHLRSGRVQQQWRLDGEDGRGVIFWCIRRKNCQNQKN